MTTPPLKHGATYDGLLQVPSHQVGEIVGGDLHVSPRPASRQVLANSSLGSCHFAELDLAPLWGDD